MSPCNKQRRSRAKFRCSEPECRRKAVYGRRELTPCYGGATLWQTQSVLILYPMLYPYALLFFFYSYFLCLFIPFYVFFLVCECNKHQGCRPRGRGICLGSRRPRGSFFLAGSASHGLASASTLLPRPRLCLIVSAPVSTSWLDMGVTPVLKIRLT